MVKKYLKDNTDSIYSLKEKIINTFGGKENFPHHYILKLFYSKLDNKWTNKVKGKMAASLENDGNGLTFSFNSGKKINLDYSEFGELEILIREYNLVKSPFKQFYVTELEVKGEKGKL
jgi:hypothetical protein